MLKRAGLLLSILLASSLVACGEEKNTGSSNRSTTAQTTKGEKQVQRQVTEPGGAEAKAKARAKAVARVKTAATTLKHLGTRAAFNLGGVSENDLLPSEKGADFLVGRGYIQEARFCKASDVLLTAENDELLLKPDGTVPRPNSSRA